MLSILLLFQMFTSCELLAQKGMGELVVRIAELEIDSIHIEEYKEILKEEAEASMRLEKGVICIFPMYEKENPLKIKLIEIYADHKAYENHLKTPHFLKYKKETLPMVMSLRLVDMEAIDKETMKQIFSKMPAITN